MQTDQILWDSSQNSICIHFSFSNMNIDIFDINMKIDNFKCIYIDKNKQKIPFLKYY
jgi:hypothetical protein